MKTFSYVFGDYEEFDYEVSNEKVESELAEMFVDTYFEEIEDKEIAFAVAKRIIESEGYNENWEEVLKERFEDDAYSKWVSL